MIRFIFSAGLFLLSVTSAAAQSLVSVTPLPNNNFFGNGVYGSYGIAATGLASDSGLWISSNSTTAPAFNYHLYNVNTGGIPSDSAFLRSNYPGNYLLGSQGLTYDGQHFWYFKKRSGKGAFFKISPSGNLIDSIIINYEYVGGIAWIDSSLWYSLYYPNTSAALYKMNVNTKTVVDTVPAYGTQPQGIASDGEYIYYVMDDNDGNDERIFAFDPALNDTAYSIALPEGSGGMSPRGLVYDGRFLWLIAKAPGNLFGLYKYDLESSGTPSLTVTGSVEFHYVRITHPSAINLILQNTGTADLTVDSVTNSLGFFTTTADLPRIIPAGQQYSIPVTFDPSSYGQFIDTLKIYSSDPIKPVSRVTLKGFGLYDNPAMHLSEESHDFGVIAATPAEAVSIWDLCVTNQGGPQLRLDSIIFHSVGFDLLTEPAFPLLIDSATTIKIRITFEPLAAGHYIDTMKLFTNDPVRAETGVSLSGTGIDTNYSLGQALWTFMTPNSPFTTVQDYSVEAIRSIPDVSGDSFDDVIIGTENYWVLCLNGNATGATDTLWGFSSGKDNNNSGTLGTEGDDAQKALIITADLNGDGFHDVVCGFGGGNEGVYALSGRTGEVIWYFDDLINWGLGDITAVHSYGDYNGDGVSDILAVSSATDENGSFGRRRVYLFDGTDGDSLWTAPTGAHTRNVIGNSDLDGDSVNDIVVATGAPRNSVIAFSGSAGTLMWEYPVDASNSGAKEMIIYPVTGSSADVIAAGFWKHIYRIDGVSGNMVWTYDLGGSMYGRTPNQLILLDDVNGNGFRDITAPVTGTTTIVCIDGGNGGTVWSGNLPMQAFGATRIPDVDRDGISDVAYASHDNRIYVVSGSNGQIINSDFTFGTGGNADAAESVHFMNDIDGNGNVEILAGCRNGMVAAVSGAAVPVSIRSGNDHPKGIRLLYNYPNPFNPTTAITYETVRSGYVTLKIYNVLGQAVKTLVNRTQNPGKYTVVWDGKNNSGEIAGSGVYICRLISGGNVYSKKMILIR